jgi:hypothetical protein
VVTREARDEPKDFIDGPLVVGVLAVLERDDTTVGSDQEVARQTEPATVRPNLRKHLASLQPGDQASRNAAHDGSPRARIEHGPRRGFHTELGVEKLLGIRDDREREIARALAQLLGRRVEHHDLANVGRPELGSSPNEGAKVKVAYRAACERRNCRWTKSAPSGTCTISSETVVKARGRTKAGVLRGDGATPRVP